MIDETHRYSVYPDSYNAGETPWLEGDYQIFTTRISRDLYPLLTRDEHTDALQDIVDQHEWNTRVGGDQPRTDALMTYLDQNGMAGKLVKLNGYTQSEWAEVLVYRPKHESDELTWDIRILRQWFAGDVYIIAYEELITYTAPNGNTIERWETVDCSGGQYLDNYCDDMELRERVAELDFV
jgi:hypothetical protein